MASTTLPISSMHSSRSIHLRTADKAMTQSGTKTEHESTTKLKCLAEIKISKWLKKRGVASGDPSEKQREFYMTARQHVSTLRNSFKLRKLAGEGYMPVSEKEKSLKGAGFSSSWGPNISIFSSRECGDQTNKTSLTGIPRSKTEIVCKLGSTFSSLLQRRAAKKSGCDPKKIEKETNCQ